MRKAILLGFMLTLAFTSLNTFASTEQEKIYLVQILNQLDAIQPLILTAQKEQPKNTRVQFHYTKYRDSQGQLRNGLLEDVQAIRNGIEQNLKDIPIEPRTVTPIKGDYLDNNEKAK